MGREDYIARTSGGYRRSSSSTTRTSNRPSGISASNNRTGNNSQSGQNTSNRVIRDVKADQEAGEADFLDSNVKGIPWLTHKQLQDNRSKIAYQESQKKQQQVQDSLKLSKALQSSGVDKDQWQRMMDKGSLSPEVALAMGLATQSPDGRIIDPATGQGWVPKGQLTEDMITGMKDLQFMQDEGVYGGTFGLEKEVNKTKGEIQNIAQDIINKNPNISTEDLKAQIEATPEAKGLAALWGGDMSSALMNTFGMRDPDFGSEKAWNKTFTDAHGNEVFTSAGDVGYDPTGQFSFRDIEETAGRMIDGKWVPNEDPNSLYNKYLNRGTLWDDPLSGVLKPQGPQFTSSGGYGPHWGGYGGGGDGGGYGWGLQQDPMQQGYQRGKVGPGTLQEQVNQLYLGMGTPQQSNPQRFSRGGIVSLLRLN